MHKTENNKPSGSADIEGFERRPKIEIPDDYEEIIEIPDTIEVPGIIEISDDEDITERDAQNFENCTLNDLKIKQEQLRIAYEKELMNNNAHGEPEGDGPSPIVDPTPAPTSDPTPITPQLDQMSFSDDSNIETDDEMSEEQLRKLTEQEKGRPLKRRDKVLYQLLDKVAKLESEMEEMRNGKNNQKSRSVEMNYFIFNFVFVFIFIFIFISFQFQISPLQLSPLQITPLQISPLQLSPLQIS